MEFRVLGPLEVLGDDGHELPVGTGHQKALLALLLLHANEVLSIDRLVDELWGGRAPPTAPKIVQNCVSQLRRAIGNGRLVTRGHGYVLQLQAGELDLGRFESLARKGVESLGAGDARTASETLLGALSLWRGAPLADFAYDDFAQTSIDRLLELRLTATEARLEAELALGRHVDLVGELEELVQAYPLRERFRAQLMLALYRSGRQAEALEAYRETRRVLDEELGLEPSEELHALERSILTHDAALAPPPRVAAPLRPVERARRLTRRPRFLVATGALLVLAAGAAVAVLELTARSETRPVAIAADSVAVIDPSTERVVAQIPVGARPMAITAGAGAVWVANADDGTVSRIDPQARKVVKTIGVAVPVSDIAVGEGSVWVAGGPEGKLLRIDPRTNAVVQTIDLSGPDELAPAGAYSVATGAGAVWVGSGSGNLLRLDPQTGARTASVALGQAPVDVASAEGDVWTALFGGPLLRIEPNSRIVTRMVGPPEPVSLAVGAGSVWVGDEGPITPRTGAAVWRIAPATVSALQQIPVRGDPVGIAVGTGAVWVATGSGGTLTRIDARSGRVVRALALGNPPLDVAVADGAVWVTVGDKTAFATEASRESP